MLPSNHRSRQIVPQHQAQLSERHTAALLQWQPFAAILELLRFEISPRYVARLIPNNVRGISLSSNPSIDAAGVQAPATLRLTGRARLADDSTGPIGYPHSAITRGARRIPGNFFVAAIQRKRPQVVTPAAPFGRMLPLRQASNHRSRQIVPQHQAQLSERHTAALLQWQPFAAILEWSRCEVSPRYVARFIPTTCGGFLFPATNSSLPPGFKPPQHCASPGKPGLPTILRRPSDFSTRLDCVIRGAFHSLRLVFICQPYQQLQAGGVIVVLGRNLRIGLRFAKG